MQECVKEQDFKKWQHPEVMCIHHTGRDKVFGGAEFLEVRYPDTFPQWVRSIHITVADGNVGQVYVQTFGDDVGRGSTGTQVKVR